MDHHSIQSEKAKAMMQYRRLRNIGKMWLLLEIFVALALFSWSSTHLPFVLNILGQFLIQLYEYLFNPHINFVMGNAIIIVVVLLSRRNTVGNTTSAGTGNVFEHYGQNRESFCDELIQSPPPLQTVYNGLNQTSPSLPAVETKETETAYNDKHIVVTENAVRDKQCDAVMAAIEEGEKQIRRFKRTQSEKRDVRSAPGRVLRRSESVVISNDERAITTFDKVDRLSSEEFRRTIEDVIAKHRRFLWAQRMDEHENC